MASVESLTLQPARTAIGAAGNRILYKKKTLLYSRKPILINILDTSPPHQ